MLLMSNLIILLPQNLLHMSLTTKIYLPVHTLGFASISHLLLGRIMQSSSVLHSSVPSAARLGPDASSVMSFSTPDDETGIGSLATLIP